MASRLTGADPARLNEAAQKASQFGNVNTRSDALDALHRAGVDDAFLGRLQGLLTTPMAKMLTNMTGLDTSTVNRAIEDLKGGAPVSSNPNQGAASRSSDGDRLAALRRSLEKVRGK